MYSTLIILPVLHVLVLGNNLTDSTIVSFPDSKSLGTRPHKHLHEPVNFIMATCGLIPSQHSVASEQYVHFSNEPYFWSMFREDAVANQFAMTLTYIYET